MDNNPTPQRPPGVGRAWLITIAAFATLILAGLYLTRAKGNGRHGDIDFKQSADDWYHQPLPTAKATPATAAPHEAPTPQALRVKAPAQVYRAPAAPQSCAACEERRRRMQTIATSPIDLKVGANTLETPQQIVSGAGEPITISIKPAAPHTVGAWSYIYAALESGINSDHPGDVLARVSQDVRDTVSQTEVLIPAGSTLHGLTKGSTMTNINDLSVVVTWDDIALPNGGHVPLPKLPATDAAGYPGLDDQVDRHLVQQFGPVTAISAITALISLSNHSAFGGLQGYNASTQAGDTFGQTMGQHTLNDMNTLLQLTRPTITVRPGTVFRVLLTRDLQFPGPYEG